MSFLSSLKNLITGSPKKANEDQRQIGEFHTLLDHLPMAIYWKDADLVYRGANARFANIAQLPSCREVIGKTDTEINSKEAAARFRKEDLEFLNGKRKDMYFTDKLVPMKNGAEIWVRTYKIPIYEPDGVQIKYIMGLLQDVTKIKRDEIALAENESRLRTILNATDNSIVFVDTSGRVLDSNGAFISNFVSVKGDVAGKFLHELLGESTSQKMHEHIEKAVETGDSQHFDDMSDPLGIGKYFDISVYPIVIDDACIGIAIFAKDITSRIQTERMLLKHSQQLEIARTEAENASKSKSDFLSRMSHEIRTPIGAIIGMTRIARNTADLEKISDCLAKIDSSSKHLLGIINDVLDMSKIEADKFTLSDDVFRIENMFMEVVNVVSVRAEEKKLNFEVFLDETLPEYFYADEMRLRQVITNLLSNAIKFTPEHGTVRLFVRHSDMEDDFAQLEIVVSDTGIGITPEQQVRLFQPFEQAEGGIARKYGGTGLGLVICKKIIEMMGGQICVESESGLGSRFIFDVKIKKCKPEKNEARRSISFSDMYALIVDDSPETRTYLSQILRKFGISSESAADGYEAIQKVKEAKQKSHAFHVIFMDWSMPGMDGIETTREIKRVLRDNAIVIMISMMEWDRIEKKAMEVGVSKFIAKPLFPSTVLTVLDQIAGTSPKDAPKVDEKGVPDLTGYRILLAEDIEINREIAAALLEPTHVKIDFATNGQEAVDMYNQNKDQYSLILMDIHMPQMDGYEATGLIRANKDRKSQTIPIVAMTADAFKEDIYKCKEVGMNDHIAKPVNVDELYRKILLARNT